MLRKIHHELIKVHQQELNLLLCDFPAMRLMSLGKGRCKILLASFTKCEFPQKIKNEIPTQPSVNHETLKVLHKVFVFLIAYHIF